MKFSIIIAERNIIMSSDTKTWIEISKKLDCDKTETTPRIKEVINLIKNEFKEIPNKMVWGNYLIFEEYENFVTIDIDYDDIDKMKNEILNIALNNNTVVLIGKENKFYRDISDLNITQ